MSEQRTDKTYQFWSGSRNDALQRLTWIDVFHLVTEKSNPTVAVPADRSTMKKGGKGRKKKERGKEGEKDTVKRKTNKHFH